MLVLCFVRVVHGLGVVMSYIGSRNRTTRLPRYMRFLNNLK